MIKDVSEAQAELLTLIEAVRRGEEVLIHEAGVPVARLVRYRAPARRVPGALKRRIVIHDDFEELPPDIAAALEGEP